MPATASAPSAPPPLKLTWEEVVAQKRAIRKSLIAPYLESALDESRIEAITGINKLEDLQGKLAEGVFTAEDVMRAYISK
jgi:hypothetical protein